VDVAVLLDLMRAHLGHDEVGPDDDFFAVGGDSLTGLALVGDAQQRGLAVTLLDLADCPTARSLAALAARPDRTDAGAAAGRAAARPEPFALMDPMDRAVVPAGAADVLPASALQVGIAYQCSRARDPALYHDIADLSVRGRFCADTFRQALTELCRRHPALRTSLDLGSFSTAAQVIWDAVDVPLTVERAAGADAAALARNWRDRQLAAGIGWDSAPAFGCHVVAGDATFHLVLAIHHAIVDGWSYALLIVDLLVLYDALLAGRAPALPAAAPDAGRDFVLLERAAGTDAAAAAFWLAQADHPALFLDAAEPRRVVDASARSEFDVPAGQLGLLRAAARSVGVPLKSLLLAAHVEALAGWTGRRHDVVTGVVSNGRPETAGADRAVGLFLNTLPMHFDPVAGSRDDRARQAFSAEQRALPHRRYPLARIERLLGRPAFDVAFNFTHFHVLDELRDLTECSVRAWSSFDKTSLPLMVDVAVTAPERATVRFTFDPDLLAPPRVAALSSRYAREIHELAVPT
jgi:aryl carrier-like protein